MKKKYLAIAVLCTGFFCIGFILWNIVHKRVDFFDDIFAPLLLAFGSFSVFIGVRKDVFKKNE
jgi:hypothetical protein